MERTPNQQTATAEVKIYSCGCTHLQPCRDHNRDGENTMTQIASDTHESLTSEERTCSDCGKPNPHELSETGEALQKSWRGEEVYLCRECREVSSRTVTEGQPS